MKTITNPAPRIYRARCSKCGAEFTYELSDVHRDYVRGGERVSCPTCGESITHFGARGSRW